MFGRIVGSGVPGSSKGARVGFERPRRKSKLLRGVLACALASTTLVAAACGGDSDGGSDGASNAEKPTLTLAYNTACTTIDPAVFGGYDKMYAYEPLVALDENEELAPALATEWEVAPGNESITFTLRDDAKFSDGTPVTAEAVKTWLDYKATVAGPVDNLLGGIESVEVVGDNQVKVTAKDPNPTIAAAFSPKGAAPFGMIVNPKAIERVKSGAKGYLERSTAGAGMYVLDPKQTVKDDHCTYVPNKHYYDQSKILWGKVVTRKITDANTMLAAMQAGEVDFGEGNSSTIDAARAAGLDVVYAPGRLQGIYFTDKDGERQPALADVRVRQALNYAVDRKAIASALFGKDAIPSSNPNPGSDGDDPETSDYYDYDPEKAKKLLAEAGYENGFTLKIAAPGSFLGPFKNLQLGQAVAADLAKVGVKVDLTETTNLEDYHASFKDGKYEGVSVIFGSDPTHLWYRNAMQNDGTISEPGWTDPASERMWREGLTASPEEAQQIWRDLMNRTIEQAFFLPVLSPGAYFYVGDRVDGVTTAHDAASFGPQDGWSPAE